MSALQPIPGRWRERNGLSNLVRLNLPAVTPGMVVVAPADSDWQRHPERRFQVWPEDLEPESAAKKNPAILSKLGGAKEGGASDETHKE